MQAVAAELAGYAGKFAVAEKVVMQAKTPPSTLADAQDTRRSRRPRSRFRQSHDQKT